MNTLGGRAEVELGKLAQSRSQSPQVRSLGEKMTADHTRANDRLARIGRSVNAEAPKGLDPGDAAFREELQRERGAIFDRRYLLKQIGDHQRTLNLLQWELSYGQNQALIDHATEMMVIVNEHLRLAQAALAELTGSAGPR
jgi:putative membrane protein